MKRSGKVYQPKHAAAMDYFNRSGLTETDRVSTMLICFHEEKDGNLSGEILNCYIDDPVWFSSAGDLILKLDELCNWIGLPPNHPLNFLKRRNNAHRGIRNRKNHSDRSPCIWSCCKRIMMQKKSFEGTAGSSPSFFSFLIPAEDRYLINLPHNVNILNIYVIKRKIG